MSTLTGYNLINHTGKFIEKAPEKYEPLITIYKNKRDEYIQTTGSQAGTIWLVRDTLQNSLHLNKVELSRILIQISMYLILHHPLDYLRSVWGALRIALIVPDEDFRIVNNSFLFRFFLPLYQLIIGVGFAGGIFIVFFKKNIKNYDLHLLMFILAIANLAASTLFDYGSNGRFFAPTYFILFIWTSIVLSNFKNSSSLE